MKELTEQEALARLTALCAQGEHCTGELSEKMRRWGLGQEAQERIMQYLVRERFVDDERYCRAFIRDKIRYNKWGRRKVEQALLAKRMDKTVFQPILDEVDDEVYVAVLRPLLQSKRRQLRGLDDFTLRGRLVRFAAGKGFTYDVIRLCVDTDGLEEECEEMDDDD